MSSGKTSPENTWQRIEYWIKRNPDKTIEECQKLLDEKIKHQRESKPSRIEYWQKKYPEKSLEECEMLLLTYKKETSFQCIEYWQKKYPEKSLEECEKLLKEAKENYLKKRPDNHGKNNPAHKSRVSLEERKKRSPMTIEFWKNKYPEKSEEECKELLKEHKEKIKSTHTPENTSTCIEYWIKKGYSEEEAKEQLKNRQATFTLEKCIKKYGKEKGEKIYNTRQEKWLKSLKNTMCMINGHQQSNWGKNFINELKNHIQDIETEYIISKYSFDIRYKDKLIELNGDYWHCNPKLYDKDFYNKVTKKYANEIWNKDKEKLNVAKQKGYKVLTIWEFDDNNNHEQCKIKCLKFLND